MERGSAAATVGLLMMLAIAFLPSLSQVAATTVPVQWTFNPTPPTNKFKAGDEIVFKYTKGQHNVVSVSKSDYQNCKVTKALATYTTGQDTVTLNKGTYYFICSFGTHCSQSGMKFAVTAK